MERPEGFTSTINLVKKPAPDYKLSSATINGVEFSYYLKDNHMKTTLLVIHGYRSSSDAAAGLFPLKNNFNIIAVNLPGSDYLPVPKQELSLDLFNTLIWDFIDQYVNSDNIVVLGHSLGGTTAAFVSAHPKVKRVIYVATVHPLVVNSVSWKRLQQYYLDQQAEAQRQVKEYLVGNDELDEIFDRATLFAPLTKKYLLNEDYLSHTLRADYQRSLAKAPVFIIGARDYVIETAPFVDFVENELHREVTVLPGILHSPMKENPAAFNDRLNALIARRRRLFGRLVRRPA